MYLLFQWNAKVLFLDYPIFLFFFIFLCSCHWRSSQLPKSKSELTSTAAFSNSNKTLLSSHLRVPVPASPFLQSPWHAELGACAAVQATELQPAGKRCVPPSFLFPDDLSERKISCSRLLLCNFCFVSPIILGETGVRFRGYVSTRKRNLGLAYCC